jgi:hypothetical protein
MTYLQGSFKLLKHLYIQIFRHKSPDNLEMTEHVIKYVAGVLQGEHEGCVDGE